ncbi:PBS lyase HEAT domain protein repeat-containing protein, partial [mine drainage metagenome]
MTFLANLRADRLITGIRSSADPSSPETQKAIARLKDLGPGAIAPLLASLPEADKNATLAFVEVLSSLVSPKTFPQFMEGLVQGSPRVIAGIAWALTSSRGYPAHLLLEALSTPGIAKSALLEVITAHKSRFTLRELLTAAYNQEPNEKAALFRVIADTVTPATLPELLQRSTATDPIRPGPH